MMNQKISFINPSRDNLKYLKWSYASIRQNADPTHEICMYDDFSSDGTWEWMQETLDKDPNVQIFRNDGPTRLGHTILYDRLIETASNDIVMIWHSDMYLAPKSIEAALSLMNPKTVVSMTRIEPPLHPTGKEKITKDFGVDVEMFKEQEFLDFVRETRPQIQNNKSQGMFAPWMIYKKDFLDIGGHDPLFAPQSREDSDIFNRFILAGYEPIQTFGAFVYHMTCRGSRYNPNLTFIGQESAEWLTQNKKSERNFIRKWGHMVAVDDNLKPIIPHKYDVVFVVKNCSPHLLEILEPWCSRIYCDTADENIGDYIEREQWNTMYNLDDRIHQFGDPFYAVGDVVVEFNGQSLNENDFRDFITKLSSILDQGVEADSEYKYGIFTLKVKVLRHYDDELIKVDKEQTVR